MSTPVRLQLSRRKGFNLQELSRATNGLEAVKVTRPGPFGNPFRAAPGPGGNMFAAATFRDWIIEELGATHMRARNTQDFMQFVRNMTGGDNSHLKACSERIRQNVTLLRGKNLACFCPLDAPCHADVLLEFANPPHSKDRGDE